MRRPLTFAAFFLIIAIVPVCAQHGGGGHGGSGGGHASSGGHAMSGGHSSGGGSFSGGSHVSAYSGSRSSSRFTSQARPGAPSRSAPYGRPGYVARPGSGWGQRGRNGSHSGGTHWSFRTRPYGYPYYGYYGPYLYPWWGGDSDPYGDEDLARDQQMADEMNSENLDEQQWLAEQDQDAYAQADQAPNGRQAASRRGLEEPPTVLVFRDGHEREIENYAIVALTLWSFAGTRTEKIPLDDLDIPATIRVNEQRGVDFQLPHASEGEGQ